jgi:tRNA 2-thiouridine synthesizing protein A
MAGEIKPDVELDVQGLVCPQPMLRTMQTLKKMKSGEILLVRATDSSTLKNIPDLCKRTNCEILKQEEANGVYSFWIKKR